MSHAAIAIPGLDRIGGAERQVMLLAKGLRRRGWRVSVVALSGSGSAAATQLRNAGIGFTSLEMRKGLADPRGWIRFNRWLRRERPDVVHAHLPHAAWLARWSRIAAPVPVVVDTLHSSHTGGLARRLGYGCSNWLTDRVTAVSCATAAAHLKAGITKENQLLVLANGIDVDSWKPDRTLRNNARGELGIADEFLWLAAGRLEAVKDYSTLLTSLAGVSANARLLILGMGPLENELRQLAMRLGLEHRVQFLGFEPNVARWMQAADGFVLSSRYEGLPMVLLEAGSCGLPAIGTDVAGTREVIVHGNTGLLARAGDPEALGATMTRLMEMAPEERRAMGARARQKVIERFDMEIVLDQWEALYTELLARTAKRGIRLSVREALTRTSATSA
jgi:glycosyltransferase involved in cell wall biosynthesis